MADPIDQYLDRVMTAAQLGPGEGRAVRAELRDHLRDLLEDHPSLLPAEVPAMLEREFGSPETIGKSIGGSKGRVRRFLRTRGRRYAVRVAVVVALLVSLRWSVAEVFYIPSGSMAPVLPRGSRCLVYKLAGNYQAGDVVVYHARPGINYVAGVVRVGPDGALRLHRNTGPDTTVPLSDVVGRVVLNTR